MRAQVADLIDRPYEPLLCIGYVRLALERLVPGFQPSDLPATREEAAGWLDRHLGGPPDGVWSEIGRTAYSATREGDLIFGTSPELPDTDYVAVLVDAAGGGFLTAVPGRGCQILPRRAFKGVRSAQRRIQCTR